MSRTTNSSAPKRRTLYRLGVAGIALSLLVTLASTPTVGATGGRAGDINGDGRDDLVIGVPDEAVGPLGMAGSISMLPGGASGGVTPAGDQLINQADLGGNNESGDRFGNAIAYGDFDNDGFGDVAIGAPTENYQGDESSGVVHIIYGRSSGLDTGRRFLLTPFGPLPGANEPRDFFGATVAAGDFNGDGYDDVVVGVPGEAIGSRFAAGSIVVAFGGSGGITTSGAIERNQNSAGVPGVAEDADAFGSALAVGDFNNDGRDDIAVGVPGETVDNRLNSGSINVFYGAPSGLGSFSTAFSQNGAVAGVNEGQDFFGKALAAGDFDADGFDDLAVGVPGENVSGQTDAGAIAIIYGRTGGLSSSGSQGFSQRGAVPGANEAGDAFGASLAAGDFNGDGDDDLAIGVPGEAVGSRDNAGGLVVLGGSGTGLRSSGGLIFNQSDLPGATSESGDDFGSALRVGDFNGDGRDDLAVGARGENVGSVVDAGLVHVIYGSGGSLSASGAEYFHQGTTGVQGALEAGDYFGSQL